MAGERELWRPFEESRDARRLAEVESMPNDERHPSSCVCSGEGWLWGHELKVSESYPTDTRYPCDRNSDEAES